jgi:hypothetical protein
MVIGTLALFLQGSNGPLDMGTIIIFMVIGAVGWVLRDSVSESVKYAFKKMFGKDSDKRSTPENNQVSIGNEASIRDSIVAGKIQGDVKYEKHEHFGPGFMVNGVPVVVLPAKTGHLS